ncbi:MAG: sulfite exporter TauE/SafE family protein [Francisellaceae bacterium]
MDYSLYSDLFVFAMIFFAGFVDCIAGGGGMLTLPTYLAVGVPPQLVLGTNKLVMSVGTFTAVIRLILKIRIYWQSILPAIAFSLAGGVLGATLSHYMTQQLMTVLLLIIIPLILVLGLFKAYKIESHYQRNGWFYAKSALVCFLIGGYDGFFGPGTGTFLFLAFMYVLSMSAQESVANAKIINLSSNVSALSYFLIIDAIEWHIVVVALPAAILGYLLGAQFVLKANVRWIKRVVTVVLICLMSKLIFF